ncbi:MAG: OadG family protein [Chloroflexi bacterium]|nr:OadG family protein [Chloroflexota bacterium]
MNQGLWIALMGMTMVFLDLGLLVAVIALLERAFRPPSKTAEHPPAAHEAGYADDAPEAGPEGKAMAAAIGLALALAQQGPAGSRREQLTQPSAWRYAGRRYQMRSPSHPWQR